MVSVVVLNTCLCVVFLSNVSKGGVGEKKGGKEGGGQGGARGGGQGGGQGGVAFYGKRSYIATSTSGVLFPSRRSPVCRRGTPF